MTEPVPFPASPYCRVRARVASIWADGPDDGTHPDWRPAAGEKVTLTPSIGSQLLTYDVAGPEPIIVTVERVECVVDEDGWLTKNDGRPVFIAPTDDPLLSATGWTWTASIKGKSIAFSAPSGGVVDLALFVATPAVDAVEYVSVVQVVADYIAANPPDVEQAVADYLTANPPAAAPDATTATKGILQLAGDLGGTATAPTVPGLADKADATHEHTAADIDSGAATDGHILTADGAGGAAWEAPPAGGGGGGAVGVTADDTPAAPAEGESASYLVTSAVVWPAGLVWSDDPDGGTAPTITGTALVSLFTVDGVTRAVMGATFPAVTVPDATAPAWSATLTTGTPLLTSVVVAASSLATDAVGVTAYEYSINNGSTWTSVAPDGLDFTLTGLVASTAYPAPQFRAKDAAGNISPVLTAQPFTTASPSADTTPPTVGTMAVSSITDTGFTLTVTGASDETGLDAAPYAFTTNGGATWSAYQSSNVYTAAGLAPGTDYSVNWRVRDGFGNVATGTAQTVSTVGTAWTPAGVDGLYAWYDPSDAATVTTEQGAVTGMLDKSPNGFDVTAATEAARGTIGTIGGLQALTFTAAQQLTATTPTHVMTDQMTAFIVAAQGGSVNKYTVVLGYMRFGVGGGGGTWRVVHRADAFANFGTASTVATTRGGVVDSTGVFQRIGATETEPVAAGTAGGAANVIKIGDDAEATVGEVIVILGRDVPRAERDQIHAYLASKWGTA